uniref:Asparagine synthetase domain-containing protein n=1 Tax=Nelumbo nucifera TaxID=4432 RepID=A0A822Z5I0_NELNU|nr:TPA_asm: hypothetical protein HUJ06_013027 [Nelumbo nucifera]
MERISWTCWMECSRLCYLTPETTASLLPKMPLGSPPSISGGDLMAVIKRLMTDVPFGVLLSGGLDSSLVASITSRYFAGTKAAKQWRTQLQYSFCVGLEGSPDFKATKEVVDYLGTIHHEFHFTVQDGIDAIEDVIYHIEAYGVTTVRASTPMFLMFRGSDEIFGGYLYFHKAPNMKTYNVLINNLFYMNWGLLAFWVLHSPFNPLGIRQLSAQKHSSKFGKTQPELGSCMKALLAEQVYETINGLNTLFSDTNATQKHRHVIKTTLSLLATSFLPFNFWLDATLTAVFLINRLPSPVLDGKSPIEKLFSSPPTTLC